MSILKNSLNFVEYIYRKNKGRLCGRYYPGSGSRKFYMRYQLPEGMTCTQCVMQWRYVTASNWGRCPNGTGIMGCGPQEEFR